MSPRLLRLALMPHLAPRMTWSDHDAWMAMARAGYGVYAYYDAQVRRGR